MLFLVVCWLSKIKKSGMLSECQIVWIQIRAEALSVLIWVQTVYKGYHEMTKVCWVIFPAFLVVCWHFSKLTFSKKFLPEHYQSVKWYGSRSGPTFCWPWSGSKLFEKVVNRRQKLLLARKELDTPRILCSLNGIFARANVEKIWTCVACQKCLDKQYRPRSDCF